MPFKIKMAERVGFEPTVPFGTTVFKTVPLQPLRYLSMSSEKYITTYFLNCQQFCKNYYLLIFIKYSFKCYAVNIRQYI